MDDLVSQIEGLSPAKRTLLELKLQKKSFGVSDERASIPRRRERESAPLSFAQQRLWFLSQIEPGCPFYNVARAIRMSGDLSIEALENAVETITIRHESLRTNFDSVNGTPVQLIKSPPKRGIASADLTRVNEDELEEEVGRLAFQAARRPFDLAGEPLIRVGLIRARRNDHVLLLVMHHVIADGWSFRVFLGEMALLYRAFRSGMPAPLAELHIQYADFATWQREAARGEEFEADLSYWTNQLCDYSSVLALPLDRPRPPVQTFNGAVWSSAVPVELSTRLMEFSRQRGVTLFMTLLAAFIACLWRYAGQDGISVGSPIANRQLVDVEGLIGFFVNTLVLSFDLKGNPGFHELLGRVRDRMLEGLARQNVPFEKLVEKLQPERELSHHPLFQVMFDLQSSPERVELPGIDSRVFEVHNGAAKFDMTLQVKETAERLDCAIEYNTDLFDGITAATMLGHYTALLESVVACPHGRVSELIMLREAERHQLVIEWNATEVDHGLAFSVTELFEGQAAQTPHAVAVVADDCCITYGELNRRANQLGRQLRLMDAGPEAVVGVWVERSIDMVVGLLGILKSGAAYLPLDPNHPAERVAMMLREAYTPVIVSQPGVSERVRLFDREVLILDSGCEAMARQDCSNFRSGAGPESLCYVMYTSGTTGKPKGIAITHRGVVRLAKGADYVNLNSEETVLQYAPITFDVSTFEIWGSLLNGARLVMAPPYQLSLEELGSMLKKHQVTTLWLPAGLFHLMVDERLEDMMHLNQLLAGGDVLSAPHTLKVLDSLRTSAMVNGYGPTEATTFACCYVLNDPRQVGVSVPIGRAITNTQVYILDGSFQVVPTGVIGELCVGGPGLAREYRCSPELTAEKFIPNPFFEKPGARLYRTGDLVRSRRDGVIEFLGRRDSQVKIRGFRIEPGEVETLLCQHPAVREAAVVPREIRAGDKSLVAYVTANDGRRLSDNELRAHLKGRLPEYMLPASFVVLSGMPLTHNGKVNRRALPVPEQAGPETIVLPRTPTEELLARIWADVLAVEQVSCEESFFHLGGHSLLATQVVSRVRDRCHVDMPVRSVFEAPTVTQFARRIDSELRSGRQSEAPPLEPADRKEILDLSFAQQRLWFLEQLEPGSFIYNCPAAVRLRGPLSAASLAQTVSEVTRRHESLRTVFRSVAGQPFQLIKPAGHLMPALVDLSGLSEPSREVEGRRLSSEEAQEGFDLSRGPLMRASLLKLEADKHILLVTMHHIISDGWSLGVFFGEIGTLYGAYVVGGPSPMYELPIQYVDYACWQRGWLQGEVMDAQVSYWRSRLEGALPLLELQYDHPRPAARTHRGSAESITLEPELGRDVKALSRNEGVTLYMTLLSAFQVLLLRNTGREDIVVGSPIAGRNRFETEGLIGFFVNTLVLRTLMTGDPSFRETLGLVREVALGAHANQELPFELLVDELSPERSLGHHPLFQVMFILQNAPRTPLSIRGLSIDVLRTKTSSAKFDLTLEMVETPQGLRALMEYSTDLFDRVTINRMLEHYRTLLIAILRNTAERISTLPLLSEAEQHQVLVDWSNNGNTYPGVLAVHELFEEQAAQSPDRVAAFYEDSFWSFREIDHQAERLAEVLGRY